MVGGNPPGPGLGGGGERGGDPPLHAPSAWPWPGGVVSMTPDEDARFITSTTKSARFHRLWQALTRLRQRIAAGSTFVYARGRGWMAEWQPEEAIRHAVQRSMARLRATSWQALSLKH